MTIQMIDFFSGCGGTSSGFMSAGFEILAGLDIDEDSSITYQKNFPGAKFFRGDIAQMDSNILEGVLHKRKKPLLFAGCAPCQPFSRQNKFQEGDDPRASLIMEFFRFIDMWKPEYIFIENVPGLQKIRHNSPFTLFLKSISKIGYNFEYKIVQALSYGVPQTRSRLVLLAHLKELQPIRIPDPTHAVPGKLPTATVRDFIFGMPRIGAGEKYAGDPDHQSSKLSALNLERIRAIPPGGSRADWPRHLWLNCHKEYKGHSDVYGRLKWNKPASGLTTKCHSFSNGRFGHPDQHRAISIREAALLQTFPMEYKFHGALTSKARQIGNAVPPLMAEAFARSILKSSGID